MSFGNGSLNQSVPASRAAAGAVTNGMNDLTVADGSNPFEPFFGPLRGTHMQPHASDRFSRETFQLPDAYIGRNKRLEDVLDFMVREEDDQLTRLVLPFEYTDEIHVNWEIFKFDRSLADIEPTEGIPRLVTSSVEARTENLIRRGLGFCIEHGFWTTDRGRRQFAMNLEQISDSVKLTTNFGALNALLSSNNYYKQWERRFGDNSQNRTEIFENERRRWAVVQKSERGLTILDSEAKHSMRMNGVTPNIWIFPSRMDIYLSLARDENVHYDKAGPAGPEALASTNGNRITTWRGCRVLESCPYDIDFTGDSHTDLLTRSRQIGEWFMFDDDEDEIHIYSADKDKFVKITRAEAIAAAPNAENALKNANNFANGCMRALEACETDSLVSNYNMMLDHLALAAKSPHAADASAPDKREAKKRATALNQKIKELKLADVELTAADKKVVDDYIIDVKTNGGPVGVRTPNPLIAALQMTTPDDIATNINVVMDNTDPNPAADQVKLFYDKIVKYENGKKYINDPNAGNDPTTGNALPGNLDFVKAHKILLETLILSHKQTQYWISKTKPKVPRKILLFRPFQTYMMSSAILCKGGSSLGSTFVGHSDFQLSDDITRKVHYGHFTFMSKSVVKRPKECCILEDVMAKAYVGGEGTKFFRVGGEDSFRNQFEEGNIGTRDIEPSLFAWVVDNEPEEDCIDIMGHFDTSVLGQRRHYKECFEGSDEFVRMNDLDIINPFRMHTDAYIQRVQNINTVCFRGRQLDKDGKVTAHGKGHWGDEEVYPGCRKVRTGAVATFKAPI